MKKKFIKEMDPPPNKPEGEGWRPIPPHVDPSTIDIDEYEKDTTNKWFRKIGGETDDKILESLISKILRENFRKKYSSQILLEAETKPEGEGWEPIPPRERGKIDKTKYEVSKEGEWYRPIVKPDPNTKTDDKGTGGGGGAAPISSLPKWVDTHKCLKGAQPIGQGDNIIIAYNDKGVDRKLSLSSNGTAVDVQDQGFTGTWKCTSDTSLVIETSKTTSSSSVGGSGGGGGLGGGGSCTESMFPPCVTALQKQENPCSYKGFALTNDKVKYQVIYYPQKARGPEGMEQFVCWIYNNGWKTGYYSCGASGPIITTDFGQLTGTNEGAYKVISSKDRASIIARLNTIPELLLTNDEGTQIIGLRNDNLKQVIREIQRLVKNGYRGKSIGELIKYLQETEIFLQTELNQDSGFVTSALEKIQQIITNNENSKLDPDYEVDTDPPYDLLQGPRPVYVKDDIKIPTLKGDFTVYRSSAYADKAQSSEMTNQYLEKVKGAGDEEESCKRTLESYMVYLKKGQMVGIRSTGVTDPNFKPNDAKQRIMNCASIGIYDRGLFRGNKKYDNAINYLNNLPVEDGGIKF